MALTTINRPPTTAKNPRVWMPKSGVTIFEGAAVGRYPYGTNAGYIDNIGADPSLEVVGISRHCLGTAPAGWTGPAFQAEGIVDEVIWPMTFPATLTTASRDALVYGVDENNASLSPVGPPIGKLVEVDSTTSGRVAVGPKYVAEARAALALRLALIFRAKGVVWTNQSDLTAFTVASDDGLTYVAGDRVLLVGQTTAAQCGLYVVGTVTTGAAPLTRAPEMPAGLALTPGAVVEIGPGGSTYGNSSWKSAATTTGGPVIGTNDPLFYPRNYRQTVTLASGTYTIGFGSTANPDEPLFLLSTTTSTVEATHNTTGGTIGTAKYAAPVASRVAGKFGAAVVIINSLVDAGTVQSADTSTVDVLITNW